MFLLDREAQNLAAKSLTTYRARLTRFITWCNDQGITTIDDLSITHVRKYIAEIVRRLKDGTAKNHVIVAYQLFSIMGKLMLSVDW